MAGPQGVAWGIAVCALSQDFDSDTLAPQGHFQLEPEEAEPAYHGVKCLSCLVVMVLFYHVEMPLCVLHLPQVGLLCGCQLQTDGVPENEGEEEGALELSPDLMAEDLCCGS